MSMTENAPVQNRRSVPHDKKGCLTCRARHKKCQDRTYPTCKACDRLNLVCRWEPKRIVFPRSQSTIKDNTTQRCATGNTSLAIPLHPQPFLVGSSSSQGPLNRILIKYYIEVLAKMLTTSQQHNSFLSAFLPMAMESKVLLDALIAFSAASLSTFDKSREIDALELRSKALASMSASVSSFEPLEHETNLAACLVLSAAEISQGCRSAWYGHLQGAKQLILTAQHCDRNGTITLGPDALKKTSEGRWLLRNFAYHDVMGSITSENCLLLEPDYMFDIFDTVDSYFGVASEILVLMAKTSTLDVDSADPNDFEVYDLLKDSFLTSSTFHNIEKSLRDWECPSSTESALVSLAHAYRDAALLYLYSRVRCLSLSQNSIFAQTWRFGEEVQLRVESTLYHLSQIELNSCAEGSSLFPLFMAGVSTTDNRCVEAVRTRLKSIIENRGFQNSALALQALEKVWNLTLSEVQLQRKSLSWSQVLEISGPGLNLS